MEKTGQYLFEFVELDRICRTCQFCAVNKGENNRGRQGPWWACNVGRFKMTTNVGKLPESCVSHRWGGEKVSFIDFKKMSEEQLRAELDRIRSERSGVGKKKRVASREGRVRSEKSQKSREAEANAEFI